MPARSKSQQRLFAMALALERGKMPKSKASKKVKAISKGMSEKEIRKFAKTPHKGLTENRALSFLEFLNEAYVDREGQLHDFEFYPKGDYTLDMQVHIDQIGEFLKSVGAKHLVSHTDDAGLVSFNFTYRGEPYFLAIDLDNYRALFSHVGDEEPIFSGPAESLIDLLKVKGLDFF
jgi:hypothetical protein